MGDLATSRDKDPRFDQLSMSSIAEPRGIVNSNSNQYYPRGDGIANRSSSKSAQLKSIATGRYEPAFGSPLELTTCQRIVSQNQYQKAPMNSATVSLLDRNIEKDQHVYRSAVFKTVMSIFSATLFGVVTWFVLGSKSGLEFFAGYLVEQSLSVDNLFVFIMLFDYFAVPLEYQSRVLTWGIIGAVIMRGVMIGLGVAVVKKFNWIIIIFAVILLVSSWKLFSEEDEDHDLSNNTVVKLAKRFIDAVDEYDGDRFFTSKMGSGKRVATPLFLCLICIELSDFIFAVDSIPAVLGVSQDPFVVYSSNIFAIMGLRNIYTLVARAVDQMPYLKPAVALVLGFVGLKMILEFFHFEISTGLSLSVVILLIGGGVVSSMFKMYAKTLKRKNSDSKMNGESIA